MPEQQSVSPFKSKSGLRRIYSALFYSMDGLRAAWQQEHAFRQELIIAIAGVVVALALPVSILEKLLLIGVLVLVLIVELLNSAIEAVVDRISLEHHQLSKTAKDLGSAAVLLTLLLVGTTWGVVLWRYF